MMFVAGALGGPGAGDPRRKAESRDAHRGHTADARAVLAAPQGHLTGPQSERGRRTGRGPMSEVPGLICCGDSTMPGIGVPAVAASGMMAANVLLPIRDHLSLLSSLK